MKVIALSIFLSFSAYCYGQDAFGLQLRTVINDSYNCFKELKAEFKQQQKIDSVFNTEFILDGTSKNEILISKTMCMYLGVISDSVKEKKGRKIVDDWKKKIYAAKVGDFKLKELKIVNWNPAKYGWKFDYGNLWVDITLYPNSENSSFYSVGISILYFRK